MTTTFAEMNIFDNLDSIYNQTRSTVIDVTTHSNNNFEHYNVKSIETDELSVIKEDLKSLVRDSKDKLNQVLSQSPLETAMQNYLCFLSENQTLFNTKISEEILEDLMDCGPSSAHDVGGSGTSCKQSSLAHEDTDLNEFLKQITNDIESKELTHCKISPMIVNDEFSKRLDSLLLSETSDANKMGINESRTSAKWSLQDIDEILKEWPEEKLSREAEPHSDLFEGDFSYKSSMNDIETYLKYEATPMKVAQKDDDNRVCDLATRHSILKSSSRFVSNRQQNVTPRVKFVLDESFGKETTPSEECIQQNVNRMFPARISKENVSRDLFPKINLKKFTH